MTEVPQAEQLSSFQKSDSAVTGTRALKRPLEEVNDSQEMCTKDRLKKR